VSPFKVRAVVIPLHDDNPTTTTPYVTYGIIIACALVYLVQHLLLTDALTRDAMYAFGAIPAVLTGAKYLPDDVAFIPPWASVLTSMFLHGGFWHLAGNVLYLWIFGNNVEEAMGHVRYFLFYVLCGTAAVFAVVLPSPASEMPLVGASGAISGVLGGYLLLYPRARVLLGLPLGFIVVGFGRFPAIWVLAAWFVMQLVMGGLSAVQSHSESQGGIAFGAHIGGFIAGLVLVAFFKRRNVPLWRRY
jgi:membrane associated rhomboid family serine protease